tara:strand:- start:504 stop:1148 length:645 start_codon:yes stop_codon:yes gene_type:complete
MHLFLFLFLSYLIGSISGSIFLGKIKGIDIRKLGSGNAGGTNAFRTVGALFAIGVVFIDIIKGYIAVKYIPLLNFNFLQNVIIDNEIILIICGVGSVLGHVYPIYHGFKGGKGAGTLVGVLAAIYPQAIIICIGIWLLILVLTGYVGLSTIMSSLSFPIYYIFYLNNNYFTPLGFFSIIIPIFIIFTHRSNILRMLTGQENRFKKIMIFNQNEK